MPFYVHPNRKRSTQRALHQHCLVEKNEKMRKISNILNGSWRKYIIVLSQFLILTFGRARSRSAMLKQVWHRSLLLAAFSFSQSLYAQDQYARHAPVSRRLQHIDTVATRFLVPINNEPQKASVGLVLINTLIEEAYTHLGKRYRSGGKGPTVFDCSGFTSYVFKKFNYLIGNSSREQYAKNKPIKRSEMQRGDLVFFTSPRSGRNVGHVGIVIDVNPANDTFTFIHASVGGGIRVSQSDEAYYRPRYIGVRRVF